MHPTKSVTAQSTMNTERISSLCSYDIKMSLEGSQNILLVSLVDWEVYLYIEPLY